jgi:membrane fusion protein, multidrug efflux system
MKNAILIVLAFALGGAATWYFSGRNGGAGPAASRPPQSQGFRGPGQDAPLVVVARVKKDQLYDTVDALGTAQANESVTLSAKVTDTVRSVNFEDGDYVDAGTVLVELTNREDTAALAEAKANLDDAHNQLRRLQELSGRGLTSKSDLDVASSKAEASQARYNAVVARLRDRLIQAPFSGVLGFRKVSPGTLLTPNTAITTLDDISTIKLDFTVPETFIGAMKPGARVIAKSPSYPQREFEGIVRTVDSRVDPVTRAVTVRAHVPNKDRSLRPGMLLTVQVVMAERTSLVVPEGAVFQVQNRAYVYRVDGDRVAHQQQIELGDRRYGRVEVKAGLEEGDLIVTEGIVKLRDGVKVRFEGGESAISERSDTPVPAKARS